MWSAFVFLSSLRLLFLNPTLSFRGGGLIIPLIPFFFLVVFQGETWHPTPPCLLGPFFLILFLFYFYFMCLLFYVVCICLVNLS